MSTIEQGAELYSALFTAGSSAGVGTMSGLFRVGIFGWAKGALAALSGVIAGAFTGLVVGLSAGAVSINGHAASLTVTWGAILIAGFVGKDLVAGLRSLGEQFKANPSEVLGRVLKALKGT